MKKEFEEKKVDTYRELYEAQCKEENKIFMIYCLINILILIICVIVLVLNM